MDQVGARKSSHVGRWPLSPHIVADAKGHKDIKDKVAGQLGFLDLTLTAIFLADMPKTRWFGSFLRSPGHCNQPLTMSRRSQF